MLRQYNTTTSNRSNLTRINDILHWIQLRDASCCVVLLRWILGYSSQSVFFQKQNVAEMNLMNMFARLTWIVRIWKARSLVAVVTLDMSLDEQNWRLCWFHTNYFIREYLFSTWLTSFESRYFKLSVHIFLMSFEASICGDSACFIYVSLKRRDKAHHLFALFYKITLFLNPLQFQMLPYSDLYNQTLSIFSYFQSSWKKRDWCGLRPQKVILLKQVAARQK